MASSELSWTEAQATVNQVAEYQIFRATKVGSAAIGDFVLIGTNEVERAFDGEITNPVTSLVFSDDTVDFGTETYQYRVDAISVFVGEAPSPQTPPGQSNVIALGTKATIGILSGVEVGDDASLSWTAATPALNALSFYSIYRSVDGGAFTLLDTVASTVLTFLDTTVSLRDNGYDYRITVTDDIGIESDNSNTVSFTVDVPLLVVVVNDATADRVIHSPAGAVWTTAVNPAKNWGSIAFGESLRKFVSVSDAGVPSTTLAMHSDDGKTWTGPVATPGTNKNWIAVAWSPSIPRFAALGSDNATNNIMTSDDGEAWTLRDPGPAASFLGRDMIWIDDFGGKFIAVGSSTFGGNNDIMTSADGITWTFISQNFSTFGLSIGYDSAAQRLVVLSNVGNAFTSDDGGLTWADRGSHGMGNNPTGVAYSTTAALFIAVTSDGFIYSSPDGITWTVRTADLGTFEGVFYAPQADLLVACENGSLHTSVNGTSWSLNGSSPAHSYFAGVEGLTPPP